MYLQNSLKIEQSKINFGKTFKTFLRKCGYQLAYSDELEVKTLAKLKDISYNEIPAIGKDKINCLIQRSNKTCMEQLIIAKYHFQSYIKQNLNNKVVECCWRQLVANKLKEHR